MNAASLKAVLGDLVETHVGAPVDRRLSPRTDCRTVVKAVTVPETESGEPPSVIRVQSKDVSAGGASLVSREPIPSRRVYLRFLLPTHWDRYLEADVVSESVREQESFTKRLVRMYVYRVRFTGAEYKVEGDDSPSSQMRMDDQDPDRT